MSSHRRHHRPGRASALLPLALAGCAHRADLAVNAQPIAAPPARPVLAPEFAAVAPPPRDAGGDYRTINSALGPDQTVWHVRAALNVAAIGCRGPADRDTVAAYNAMLASKKALLARVNTAVQASFRAEGADGDAYMTRLYNYFAMPAAKPGFCAAAATLAPQAATATPEAFPAFAATALPALEAPFLAVYRQVDDYRLASAEWDRRYGAGGEPTRLAEADAPAATVPAAGLPSGSGASAGHYDLPRAFAPRHTLADTAAAAKPDGAPRLAYADLGAVVSWQPAKREALASR